MLAPFLLILYEKLLKVLNSATACLVLSSSAKYSLFAGNNHIRQTIQILPTEDTFYSSHFTKYCSQTGRQTGEKKLALVTTAGPLKNMMK